MKRIFSVLLCVLLLFSCASLPAFAAEPETVTTSVRCLEDGSYIVTELRVSSVQPMANTRSGSVTEGYYSSSGVLVFTVQVVGTFTYTGTGATATSASANVSVVASGASLMSKKAYTSGPTAYASASVLYEGRNRTLTVQLTCSATGVLS